MTFGPSTLTHKSLGGSEQAGLLICKALAAEGHQVTSFCNLPEQGKPDHVQSGAMVDGVRWVALDQYQAFIGNTEVDLLVVQRDFRMLNTPHQAKKTVLWAHDLATHTWTAEGMQQLGTNWDEIWTVSEFHRQQFHKVTGYPLESIKATRNGIVPIETMDMGPRTKTLLYAARPERGLEHLVKEGGIMDRLKGSGFKLKVCMYDNFPDHMRGYYEWLFGIIASRDDCEHMGSLTQAKLRQEMRNAFAYVYCTDFEETSCLLAREAMEQQLPIICSRAGALPETVGKSGIILKGPAQIGVTDAANIETYDTFASMILALEVKPDMYKRIQQKQAKRKDLYWDGVAKQWTQWCKPRIKTPLFSRAWSLVQDSDVIPAIALIEAHKGKLDFATTKLYRDMQAFYPFLSFKGEPAKISLKAHYDHYYKTLERPKTDLKFYDVRGQGRWQGLRDSVKHLEKGANVLDYACGEGSQLICLAMEFPHLNFYGIDISEDEVECCIRNAKEQGLEVGKSNIKAIFHGTSDAFPDTLLNIKFDLAMMNEVLEHVHEPWDIANKVEALVVPGGRVVLTVPQGEWELHGCRGMGKDQYKWRAHIWHLDKAAIRDMFREKKNTWMARIPSGMMHDGRSLGNLVYSYEADQKPIKAINPLQKAKNADPRDTIGVAVICMNDQQNILRMLDSLHYQVQVIQFAQGPSTDNTRAYVNAWLEDHPWIYANWIDVPAIHAPANINKEEVGKGEEAPEDGFGFEDARNASCEGLDNITNWTLWIDCDEYVSGNMQRYVGRHAFDSLAIHQHHFSVEPRGTVPQIDRPARLFRNGVGFRCYGKVHEHFEKGANKGPGWCHLTTGLDIGHTGYVNEETRRQRFLRNFPLLQWDRLANPDRRLGKFLWFRDIVHRMRYHAERNEGERASSLAHDGIKWYDKYREEMDSFGNGTTHAFGYYGECLKLLGRGLAFEVMIKMSDAAQEAKGGRTAQFSGVADDPAHLQAVLGKMVKGEIEKRNSKYWR